MSEEDFKLLYNVAKDKLVYHTIQLWEVKNKYNKKRRKQMEIPIPLGTGILFEIDGYKFIFSCYHVLKEFTPSNLVYIKYGEKFINLSGEVTLLSSIDDGQIDLACIKLDQEIAAYIDAASDMQYLQIENIGYGATIEENEPIVCNGFPELKTTVNQKTLDIKRKGNIFILPGSKDEYYKHYKLDKDKSYCLDYNGKVEILDTGKKGKKIDLEGMSGGGIWKVRYKTLLSEKIIDYHLIGILICYKKKPYYVLCGSRIEYLINSISKKYNLKIKVGPT